jgi:transcription elongation factor S-II
MSIRKIDNPDLFRSNIKQKLNEILEDEKNSNNMEKGIFNYSLKEADRHKIVKKWDNTHFVQIYIDRLRSVVVNLKGEILEHIKDGAIKPHTVAFMTHQELAPEKWGKLIEAKTKRDLNKCETNMSAATDTFTCRKCKGNQCTFYQLQTRSADEPMTTFVTCLLCSTRFKF